MSLETSVNMQLANWQLEPSVIIMARCHTALFNCISDASSGALLIGTLKTGAREVTLVQMGEAVKCENSADKAAT